MGENFLAGWLNDWVHRTLDNVASGLKPPRFFSEKEWSGYNSKSKLWVKYKHFMMMKSQGDSEVSVLEGIIYLGIGAVGALKFFELPIWLMIFFPVWLILTWGIKYAFGDYKDKKDLIALETELGNRRNKVFRELRELNGKH